jgi:hypothetical protein
MAPTNATEAIAEIVEKSLAALLDREELPKDRKGVVNAGVFVFSALLDEYMKPASPLAAELDHFIQAFFDTSDEIVGLMNAGTRQEVWSVLNILKQRRRQIVKASGGKGSEGDEGNGVTGGDKSA